jgi:hypothetical protein
MRTRQRSHTYAVVSNALTPSLAFNCAGVPAAGTPYGAFADLPIKGDEEKIADVVGDRQTSHPVEHRRRSFDFTVAASLGQYYSTVSGYPGYGTSAGSPSNNYWPRFATLRLPNSGINNAIFDVNVVGNPVTPRYPPSRWSWPALTPSQESILKENCFEKARGLKAEILQDLIELNQVWPSITGMAKALPLIKSQWPKLRKAMRNYKGYYDLTGPVAREIDSLRRFTANGAGGYLAYKFGALPLLMDIHAVRSYLSQMEMDVKRFATQKVMRYSSHAELVASFDATPYTEVNFGVPFSVIYPSGKAISPPIVRYVLLVRPNQYYMTDFFKKLHVVLSRFAESPASLAWELIPYSFVADWFVDMRGFLRQADNLMGAQPYDVVGFTRSFSYELESSFVIDFRTTCGGNGTLTKGPLGSVGFKHYERTLASVSPTLYVAWKPHFGKSQAAISAALIAQYLFRK